VILPVIGFAHRFHRSIEILLAERDPHTSGFPLDVELFVR
jgi:hypothetical protein